jgi:hypothetical protein
MFVLCENRTRDILRNTYSYHFAKSVLYIENTNTKYKQTCSCNQMLGMSGDRTRDNFLREINRRMKYERLPHCISRVLQERNARRYLQIRCFVAYRTARV